MFEITTDDLVGFGGLELVQLLRRLLYAEAHAAQVPLFNVAAPLQITIADGGKDAHVVWTGGADHTPYFPHRDVVFQCKATDRGDAAWTKETWTKKSQRGATTPRVLNPALDAALSRGASYIGVTLSPLVGDKPAERIVAIKDGIRQAKRDPAKLHSVHLYEANDLVAWTNRHHAVALWVKERRAGAPLAAFRTLTQWGQRADMTTPAFVPAADARFAIGDTPDDRLTFDQFAARLAVDMIGGEIRSARITGASGLGKTRSVFEAVRAAGSDYEPAMAARTIFCDYRHVSGGVLWDAANRFATHDTPLVLIVDECPREEAKKLHDLAASTDSPLRVVTIDTDTRPLSVDDALSVDVLTSEEDLIKALLAELLPKASQTERDVIVELCAGFPRIAILAAKGIGDGSAFQSQTDAAEQILRGARLTDPDTRRALGCLSLFQRLAYDRPPEGFDAVATQLARMNGDELYDHLVTAVEMELAGRYGGELSAQPRPIANHLGLERLAHLRPSVVRGFLETASDAQRQAMLSRFRYLSRSPTLAGVAQEMLGWGGALNDPAQILSPLGGELLDALVHVDPYGVAATVHYAILNTSIDDLAGIGEIEGVLNVLQRLAFRTESFPNALRDLLKLSAAGPAEGGGRAAEVVEHLFHLHLSGTAAPSRDRYAVLDEALEDEDPRMRASALRALQGGLEFDRFMRSSGFEDLGQAPPAIDWSPTTQEETLEHIRSALTRLTTVRKAGGDLAERADRIVGGELRRLLWPDLIDAVRAYIEVARGDRGFWSHGAKAIGDWLYFDRSSRPGPFGEAVRALYDALLPTDPVEQAILYSQFWPADLRDPDLIYRAGAGVRDYEYSARQAAALAVPLAADPTLLSRVIQRMAATKLNAPTPFTEALAPLVEDPEAIFAEALEALGTEDEAGLSFVLSLLRSLDRAHPSTSETLAEMALASPVLTRRPITVYAALQLNPARLADVAGLVRLGEIAPYEAIPLSYGRSIDAFTIEDLQPLLDALVEQAANGGTWAAIEMLSMYFYDRKLTTAEEAEVVRSALLAPLGEGRSGGVSGHAYEVLVKKLDEGGGVTEAFAEGIADQIIAFCQSGTSEYGSSTVEALQSALAVVLQKAPEAVWVPLAAFYEVASRSERSRLFGAITKRSLLDERSGAFDAGLLFGVPYERLEAWAAVDPKARLSFLVSFFPILERSEQGDINWHPAFKRLLDRFEDVRALRYALRARIFPRSWSGSINAYLEPFIAPLTAWKPHATWGLWATETLDEIDRRLKAKW
jgi:hypothetical protein